MRPEDLTVIYKTLGEVLKKRFTGGEAWVISSKEELFDAMRLRPSFKVPLQNGSIDCELRKYVTFSGKLEDFRGDGGIVKTEGEKKVMGEKKRFRDGRERTFSRKFDEGFARERQERRERDRFGGEGREERPRRDEDFFEDDELAAQYRNLRSRHRSFEGAREARDRKERGEERPRKGGDRDFKGGGRDFKGGRGFKGGDRDFKGGKKPFKGGRDKKF